MENISTSTSSNNSVPSLSSMEVPPRADGIALGSAFVFEAVLIVAGNLLTIAFFAMKKKLRKKSLLLVINMAFADVMLGAVSLPLYIYLWVGPHFNLWSFRASLELSFLICDTIFSQASLISAVFISCERFFAAVLGTEAQNSTNESTPHCSIYGVDSRHYCFHDDDRADLPTIKKTRMVYLGVVSIDLSSNSLLL